jgi:hypothetical protein
MQWRMRVAHFVRTALVLALLVFPCAPAAGVHVREKCTYPTATLMLYVSGLSPSSPMSAQCERCITSFALTRLNQTKVENTFGYEGDSTLSCLALYTAATLGLRTICLECQTEVSAIRSALDGHGDDCSEPMQRAIDLAERGCARINLSTFSFDVDIAQLTCRSLIPQALSLYIPENSTSQCRGHLNRIHGSTDTKLADLPSGVDADTILSGPVARDIVDVEGLDKKDMDTADELTGCYAAKPYSLADDDPTAFCVCLMEGNTVDKPGVRLSAVRRVFQATDLASFGVKSLMRESLRRVLIDTAQCFGQDDAHFFGEDPVGLVVTLPPSPSPTPRPGGGRFNPPDPDPECFPGSAMVELESGASKRMDAVSIGDRVAVGSGRFSDVFMFTHRDPLVVDRSFVTLTTGSGNTLTLTSGHYVPIDRQNRLVAAREVRPGDTVFLRNGTTSVVVTIGVATLPGLFNPQTLDGRIVVDGVVSSTYTMAVEPVLAHDVLLVPVRWLYGWMPLSLSMYFANIFRSGSPSFAALLPSGEATLLR